MVTRVFTGWDRPFLQYAAAWLLERREKLPGMLVVVPTSHSGRRLREALVEPTGALLSPRIVTPAWFLRTPAPDVAPDWAERVAWLETLENIRDWSHYPALLPEAPDVDGDWAGGLARELTRLRRRLQENGHTLSSAGRALGGTVEQGRWDDLARLEFLMERRLREWGYRSRSQILAQGIAIQDDLTDIVVAGVAEMPPLVERSLLDWDGKLTVLVGAPEAESVNFSIIGRPLPVWASRIMPWPDGGSGSVRLAADSRQQAAEAFRAVCESGLPSNEVALGSADPETSAEIARVFTRGGWTAFDPSAALGQPPLCRWLTVWMDWLADPRLSTLQDLLTLPETDSLIFGGREKLARILARIRDKTMVNRAEDIRIQNFPSILRSESDTEAAKFLVTAVNRMLDLRESFQANDFSNTMKRLLETINSNDDSELQILTWLDEAEPMIREIGRTATFWLGLMLSELPTPIATPPDGRVIDVQGWLELFFESGRHLVLCGMNEGRVPAASTGDSWLGESAAAKVGLATNADRAARDAFLHMAMVMARKEQGRVDLLCAKAGPGGESLLPSRLLLAAERDELPARVRFLFREVEPPEAGLRWHADWKWTPRPVEISKRLSATSLRAWLACPFRFYLKHAVGMQIPEPDRVEWNARDFGNIAHEILECWGRDEEARDFSKTEALEAWFSKQLDQVVGASFGRRPPLAVRVQTESLRQRLAWLARVQAINRAAGWETIEVEHKFEISFGDWLIVAKIDRIDRHREDGRIRVIDYKTGKVDDVAREHRRKVTSTTRLPVHLSLDSPAVYATAGKDKAADFRWVNLQLPLYALAIQNRDGILAEPCYFKIGSTEANVDLVPWDGFSQVDLSAARDCASWVVEQIAEGVFWPPAESTDYDDFEVLAAGRTMEELFHRPLSSTPTPSSTPA